ncbi:hypothetical protein D9N00_27495 [Pseudomonas syringae pv. actinidiae]|nr:hypothetical protein D9N00_27495 [Pseudomonas syringae pv. actinidiae]AYL79414.1 hypothetical protein CN228_05210 [Pseudomonas syringae pv. actinidiae str. Shaanxi_M228]
MRDALRHRFATPAGNRTTAHNPAGGRFSRVSSPPWACTQARAMASPRPSPPP